MVLPALALGRGPDFSQTLLAAASLKKTGLETQILERKMGREDKVAGLRSRVAGAATGEARTEALGQLGAEDTEAASQMFELFSGMEDQELEEKDRQNTQIGRLLVGIREVPPEQQALAYAEARAQAVQLGVPEERMPEEYDPRFIDRSISLTMKTSDTIKSVREEKDRVLTSVMLPGGRKELRTRDLARGMEPAEPEKGPYTEAAKANADFEAGRLTPSQHAELTNPSMSNFKNAKDLRAEYISQSKDFVEVRDAYSRIKASAVDPSAAGDLALIFNYMKVLDPGSVVRESEFATAAASGSLGERIKAAAAKIAAGERLSDEMRKDFVDRAGKLFEAQKGSHTKRVGEYKRLSKRFGIAPEDVLVDLSIAKESEASPLSKEEQTELEELRRKYGG